MKELILSHLNLIKTLLLRPYWKWRLLGLRIQAEELEAWKIHT